MKSGFLLKSLLRKAAILILCAVFSSCSSGEITDAPAVTEEEAETEQLRTYVWETEAETLEYAESDYEYDFKPYAVTAGQRDNLTSSDYDAYCKTIDAFINASETIEMTAQQADAVVSVLAECFPPVWLAESLTFIPDKAELQPSETAESEKSADVQTAVSGILNITYKYDKAKHSENIQDFFKRTAFIMNDSGAAAAATDEIAAILLYRYTAKSVTDVAGKRTSSFDAIMYGTDESDGNIKYTGGGSHTLAYVWLLLQADIDCTAVTGMFYDLPRMLCAVVNGGELFYCDPAGEMNGTMGAGLSFFGINDADLSAEGLTAPVETGFTPLFLFNYTPAVSVSEAPAPGGSAENEDTENSVPTFTLVSESLRYKVFRGSDYFEFDALKSQITVYYRENFNSDVYVCAS